LKNPRRSRNSRTYQSKKKATPWPNQCWKRENPCFFGMLLAHAARVRRPTLLPIPTVRTPHTRNMHEHGRALCLHVCCCSSVLSHGGLVAAHHYAAQVSTWRCVFCTLNRTVCCFWSLPACPATLQERQNVLMTSS
jgi:hypothetical protein